MHIKETKQKNGRINISIIERYWDPQKKSSRQRTVLGFGRLDLLDEKYGDGRAHVKAILDEMNAEKEAAEQDVTIVIHPAEKIDKRVEGQFKNLGSALILAKYNALGIETVIRNAVRGRRFDYDVNAILRLLTVERVVEPSSKLSAWENRHRYFFRSEFSDDDVYRSLDFLAELKEPIISALNRSIARMYPRDTSSLYYDVTNYYFEIDEADELRKEGYSKEYRKSPIIQMGLLQDKNAIPIGFDIFPGNTHDSATLIPALANARKDLGAARMIMVADKGINTSENIAALVASGNGFVFSQSIKGTKSTGELRNWVISGDGYYTLPGDSDEEFKIKSRQDTKIIHVTDPDGREHDVDIDIKVVAFWSARYDRKAKYDREKVVEKARALIADPSRYDRAIHYGATTYIKNVTINKKTGELLTDAKRIPVLDEELIKQQEKTDGYYTIITSETNMTDEQIIDTYRGLWRIEEAFRVTKSFLENRPVYVRLQARITAHFLTCYIALTIIRLIQMETGFAHSAESIIKEIRELNGVSLESNWWRFYHRSDLLDELGRSAGIVLNKKNMQLSEIKAIFAQVGRKKKKV